MMNSVDRRRFLKTSGGAVAALGLTGLCSTRVRAAQLAQGAPHAEKLGWRLGCQAYSFNRFSFYEALEKIQSLGLHYVEMYPGQKLSGEQPDVKTNDTMSPEVRQQVLKRLADSQITLAAYGVCPLPNDEAACRKTFDFAKQMGIETVVSEPPFEALPMIDKLCAEYALTVAIHNHPEPSRYWNPDTVLEHTKGLSKRVGACADTGHWMRSGINPLEAIKKLEGRIISFHFKDLNGYGKKETHDVPWGTGKADVPVLLAEIRRQGIKALFSIEYEYNWENSLPEIAESVKFFDKVAAQL